MPIELPKVGQVKRAMRDIPLTRHTQIKILSPAAPTVLKKGTEAEITAITPTHFELNCKDGIGKGPEAWGLRIQVQKSAFGNTFE